MVMSRRGALRIGRLISSELSSDAGKEARKRGLATNVPPGMAPPRKPPVPPGRATPTVDTGVSGTAQPGLRPAYSDPTFLIPLFGLPACAAWYSYEIITQWEHEDRIEATTGTPSPSAGPRKVLEQVLGQILPPRQPSVAAEQRPSPPQPATPVTSAQPASPTVKPPPSLPEQRAVKSEEPVQQAPAQHAQETLSTPPASSPPPPASEPAVDHATPSAQAAPLTAQPRADAAPTVSHEQTQAAEVTALVASVSQSDPRPEAASSVPPVTVDTETLSALPAAPPAPVLSSRQDAEHAPVKKGDMGVTLDLTPSGLVAFANERSLGPGGDWTAFTQHHKQATADAELFGRAAAQIIAWHEAQMGSVSKERDAALQQVEDIREKAKAATEMFKRLLRQHQEMATELRTLEVAQAEKRVALAASQAAQSERVERTQALDQVRVQLGALAEAHDVRTAQQAAGHVAHVLSLSVMALEHALTTGVPVGPYLSSLLERAEGVAAALPAAPAADVAVVRAAVSAIPPAYRSAAIPTSTQLSEDLRALRGSVASLALLPAPGGNGSGQERASSGGILAHAFAKLVAWFAMDERHSVRVLGPEAALQSPDATVATALAAAEVYVAQGRILEAARVLHDRTHGSAAAAVVEQWCRDAAARAAAEQAVHLLRAHATVLAASAV